ncbi:MAG: DUF354 domain-containing protein [Gammaproteobacteria bacterium]|nr:DUF354 domain-containing protein [Gammaproteobacteria bacterium]
MNIWIDITNSPHINFFRQFVGEMRTDHEIIITCRDLANTIDLISREGWAYHRVGRHYGAASMAKLLGFPIRIFDLVRFLRSKAIDVAISHSSFYSPLSARLLGAQSLYINDNEHAMGNWLAVPPASVVLLPEFLEDYAIKSHWPSFSRLEYYPGVKEGIYLWNSKAVRIVADRPRIGSGRRQIFFRPEPWTAQYYSRKTDHVDALIQEIGTQHDVLVLPRSSAQTEHYRAPRFQGVVVADQPLSLEEIAGRCDGFLGAGGTMTRELALLGVPTFSLYQDLPLRADEYLVRRGMMRYKPNASCREILQFFAEAGTGQPDWELLAMGEAAYRQMTALAIELGENHRKGAVR